MQERQKQLLVGTSRWVYNTFHLLIPPNLPEMQFSQNLTSLSVYILYWHTDQCTLIKQSDLLRKQYSKSLEFVLDM